jgi:hypothetical protein
MNVTDSRGKGQRGKNRRGLYSFSILVRSHMPVRRAAHTMIIAVMVLLLLAMMFLVFFKGHSYMRAHIRSTAVTAADIHIGTPP